MAKKDKINYNIINFEQFVKSKPSDEEYLSYFRSVSDTMKYVHDNGYVINSFDLKDINVIELPSGKKAASFKNVSNFSIKTKQDEEAFEAARRGNIFNMALIMVGVYCGTIFNLNAKFTKENFKSHETFLPSELVSYLSGIIEHGYGVYLNEYLRELNKKHKEQLAKEADSVTGKGNSNTLSKNDGIASKVPYGTILGDQYGNENAAFISMFLYPAIIFLLSLMIPILAYVLGSK